MKTNASFDPDDYHVTDAMPHPEAVALLRRIATGEVALEFEKADWNWEKVYVGHVSYHVEGWTIMVFNDCNEFDYIEYMRSPDGREGDFHGFHESGAIGPEEMLEREEPRLHQQMVKAFVEAR